MTKDIDRIFPGWRAQANTSRCSEEKARQLLLDQFLASGCPPLFHEADFEDFPLNLTPLTGKSVYLYGERGRGKTRMAAALQKDWMMGQLLDRNQWSRMQSAFVSVSKLIMDLIQAMNDKSGPSAAEMVNRLCNVPFLILDDLGTQQGTDYTFNVLYVIVNERYGFGRTTIVTSNFDITQLSNNFSEAIAGRLYEMCEVVEVEGRNWRKEN